MTYPAGFDVSSISSVNTSTMDGTLTFSVLGTVVTLTRSGGSIQAAGAEIVTITTIANPTTTGSKSISVQTQNSTGTTLDTGSALLSVTPGPLDEFRFDLISSPQTAGSAIPAVIKAYDAYDNVKTDFTGTATLTDPSATIIVQTTGTNSTGNFVSGTWNGNVFIAIAQTDVRITASGSGKSGSSWYFNVVPAGVSGFIISPVGTQSAGMPFLITVTARDINSNTATSFSGSGKRVSITHNGGSSGGISPIESGDFSNGSWTGQITISSTKTGDQITVQNTSGTGTGLSNTFDVTSSTVDHFSFTTIAGPKTAGSPFTITVTAQDALNNTVTSFNGTVNLTDLTGDCSPQQMTFSSGMWSNNVTINKSMTGNRLTANGVGKTSNSNTFNVNPAALDHFEISNIGSPQTAGSAFTITLTAKDIYENTVTGFTGSVSLSTGSGTISPVSSGAFSGGVKTLTNVILAKSQDDAIITVTDGSSHIGTSNKFNVTHGVLNHFDINPIADQATGMPFVVTITAKDLNENTVTSFNGPGNTVNIVHSGSGSISPGLSTSFVQGVWSGSLQINLTQASDHITVTRTAGGAQTGVSNNFKVSPSNVDHFIFSTIASPQTAGAGFAITITAQDANNNTAVAFSGTANLDDVFGSVQPQQVTFTSGVCNSTVTVTKAGAGNSLTVNGSGKSGTSNVFHIMAASVQYFDLSAVASPKIAGTPFQLIITARDQYGNTATSFNGSAQITDVTGTITPATSSTFSAGSINQNVSITRAQDDVSITVRDGSGHSGKTNIFNVISTSVDHFEIDPIGDQVARMPFILTIVAHDQYHNIVTTFTETVDITDVTGTINPAQSGHFVNGVWSGGVTIYPANQTALGDRIDVVRTGNPQAGSSTLFNVYAPPGVRVVEFTASRSEVTVNQEQDWSLLLSVRNLSSSNALLDSLRLKLWLSGQVQSDYFINIPSVFKRSATPTLAGNSMDTLSIVVSRTGARYGDILIEANAYFTDTGTNGPVRDQGKTGIVVQDSARLSIERIRVSQTEVSQGQEEDWTATVVLRNRGGSTALLDSSRLETHIQFSSGTDWSVVRPAFLFGGGWTLTGGETDSLIFFIDKTGIGSTGICLLNGSVAGTENNTGRKLKTASSAITAGAVKIEKPAQLQIMDVTISRVPHVPYVNISQSFTVLVSVRNAGGDDVNEVQVSLTSDGSSSFLDAAFKTLPVLAGGGSASFEFPVQASGISNPKEIFSVSVTGYVDNTKNLTPYLIDTTKAVVQYPAVLLTEKPVTTALFLTGGQKDLWYVKVPVRNTGQADLTLGLPGANDITFWIGALQQTDYSIKPPLTLKKGGLILKQSARDTLVYTVNHTGILGGKVEVRAQVSGVDRNANTVLTGSNSTSIDVNSDKAFRIMNTQVQCPNRTDAGNGYVNTSQNFQVFTVIENGFGQTLRNIKVQLRSNGLSAIGSTEQVIDLLRPSASDTLYFGVTADKKVRSSEIFKASIIYAELENAGYPPPIGAALDSIAQIAIQEPAKVTLALYLSNPVGQFSTNQEFTLSAYLYNQGTASIDSSGRVRISLPGDYQLLSAADSAKIGFVNPVTWKLKAPPESKSVSSIYATLYRLPKDINTGNSVLVDTKSMQVDVVTLMSSLYPQSFGIVEPVGARDNVLSCGQAFVIRTQIVSKNTKNIKATLELPGDFKTADNLQKSALLSELFWQVTAPAEPTSDKQYIFLKLAGVDSLQDNIEITGIPGSFSVIAVVQAKLTLDLNVLGPVDVMEDNTVSPGQEFMVGVSLTNSGLADTTGNAVVTLDPLPDGYGATEALTKTLVDGKAAWTLQAPFQQTGANVSITAKLIQVPKDENTDKSAIVIQAQDKIPIFIESSWLAVWTNDLPIWVESVIQPGQSSVKLMDLELDNRGEEGANRIIVDSLRVDIEDRFGNGIPPSSVLSSIIVLDGNDSMKVVGVQSAIPESNPVSIPLVNVMITTEKNQRLALYGAISNQAESEIFQISLSGKSSIAAKDPYSKNPIQVKSPVGDEFVGVISAPKKIFKPESEPMVWNYPNPFGGSGKEETKITYFMSTHQEVVFKLYTLAGEPVWSLELPFSDPKTQEGSHTVTWNGRNDRGLKVLNGVYLLFMKTADGKVEKTKIAIVK